MKNPRLARRPPRACSLYIVHCTLSKNTAEKRGSEKMQTRTEKWVKNDLSEDPYRFHHATEAVLRCNSCCFTMQNRLRCSVTQAPLQPKRIFDCVLNLYTFRANFVSLSFSTVYEHAHISPVRTEKIFGSEFLNLRGAIVKCFPILHSV